MKQKLPSLFVIATVALVLLAGIGATPAAADSGARTYTWLLATGFLCGLASDARGPACPAVSIAANGDTIELSGTGTLTIHPKSVSGGGVFTHNFAGGGSVSGLWTVNRPRFRGHRVDGNPPHAATGRRVRRARTAAGV